MFVSVVGSVSVSVPVVVVSVPVVVSAGAVVPVASRGHRLLTQLGDEAVNAGPTQPPGLSVDSPPDAVECQRLPALDDPRVRFGDLS